jgi:hypothetical protein
MRITPENITALSPNEIFVFGSNYLGKHGKGAAYTAFKKFGAVWGIGRGLQGNSYGIPTKGTDLRRALPIAEIEKEVLLFIKDAKEDPQLIFLITEIGCGLAGYTPKEIAPLFRECVSMENVYLPERFWTILSA